MAAPDLPLAVFNIRKPYSRLFSLSWMPPVSTKCENGLKVIFKTPGSQRKQLHIWSLCNAYGSNNGAVSQVDLGMCILQDWRSGRIRDFLVSHCMSSQAFPNTECSGFGMSCVEAHGRSLTDFFEKHSSGTWQWLKRTALIAPSRKDHREFLSRGLTKREDILGLAGHRFPQLDTFDEG